MHVAPSRPNPITGSSDLTGFVSAWTTGLGSSPNPVAQPLANALVLSIVGTLQMLWSEGFPAASREMACGSASQKRSQRSQQPILFAIER